MSKDLVSKEDVFKVSCMLEYCGINFISSINAELDDKKEPWYKRPFKKNNSQSDYDSFQHLQAFVNLLGIAYNDYFFCSAKYGGEFHLFDAMIAVINRDEHAKTLYIGKLILSLASTSFIKVPSFNYKKQVEYKNITSYYHECELKAEESIKKQNMVPKTLTDLQIVILASLITQPTANLKTSLSEEAFTSFCKIKTELAILAEKKHQESSLSPIDQILKNKYIIAMLFDSDLPDSLLTECACLCASIENLNSDYRNTEFVLRKYKNVLFILDEVLNRASQDVVKAPQKEEITKEAAPLEQIISITYLTDLQIAILAHLISTSTSFCKTTLSEEAFTSFCKIKTELAVLAEKKHQESSLPPIDPILKYKYIIAMLFDSDLPDSLLAECACLCTIIQKRIWNCQDTEFLLRKYKDALFIHNEILNEASQDVAKAPQKEELRPDLLAATQTARSIQTMIAELLPYEKVVLRELLEEQVNQLTPTENLIYDCERLATKEGLRSVRINNITINCRLNND